jgi:plasmid stabilization system protein ParE
MPVVQRTAQADEDLIDIWVYIAQDHPDAADHLLDALEILARRSRRSDRLSLRKSRAG